MLLVFGVIQNVHHLSQINKVDDDDESTIGDDNHFFRTFG